MYMGGIVKMTKESKLMLLGMYIAATADVVVAVGVILLLI